MNNSAPAEDRVRVRRSHERGRYDRETIDAILDAGVFAHIGFVDDGRPVVIPMIYWRDGDYVYWHGSTASRAMKRGCDFDVCVTVTLLDGLVLAKSAFHHSANYRSVLLLGKAEAAPAEDKEANLHVFMEGLLPGRDATLRPPTRQELKATTLLRIKIEAASAKIRTGPPVDDEEDRDHPVWTGVVPVESQMGSPVPTPGDEGRYEVPEHINHLQQVFGAAPEEAE